MFGFPTLKGGSSGPGDPLWSSVVLLLKFNGTDGSTNIVDSSSFADNKTAGSGQELDTAQSRFGGSSLLCFHQQPTPLLYTGTRFARGAGTAFTVEGFFRRGTTVNVTATPPIFLMFDSGSAEVVRLSQYSTGDEVECRISGSGFTQHAYTPDANGWVYWCIRVATDNTTQLYLGTTLVKSGSIGSWSGSTSVYVGGSTATSSTGITFWMDETRMTMADRYPSGPTAVPTEEFPVGAA